MHKLAQHPVFKLNETRCLLPMSMNGCVDLLKHARQFRWASV
jgi:hypothetical protein